MKFVENHLNKHHLLHAPHKWFLAFISSPIHFAEIHYKKKYHLKFEHARKLFFFDIILLLSAILLLFGTIFLFTYDPTITDLVYLSIKSSPERIISGDYVSYEITYKNESEVTLKNPYITLRLPEGFVVEKAEPSELFDDSQYIFNIPELRPENSGTVTVEGRFYGTPHTDIHLEATLIYTQEGRKKQEFKKSPNLSVLRGSVLSSKLELPGMILPDTTVPFNLTLLNEGDISIESITVPINLPNGVNLSNPKPTKGNYKDNTWSIEHLETQEKPSLTGILEFNLPTAQKSVDMTITPFININNTNIAQETLEYSISVIHPHATLEAEWTGNTHVLPEETASLELRVTNNGDVDLSNVKISIAIPDTIVDLSKLIALNQGVYLNSTYNVELTQELKRGQTKNIDLNIPIKYIPQGGTDITLTLTPTLSAQTSGIPNQKYNNSVETPPLAIGTQILLNSELRYYTDEGDQLGRGPLPPQVGKETRYWAFITIQNTSSKLQNVSLKATLTPFGNWTGKTSVSHGQDIIFNPGNRTISWNTSSLNPHETAGVYFELGITPTQDQIGTKPILLNNINVTGYDTYTDEQMTRAAPNLDVSL